MALLETVIFLGGLKGFVVKEGIPFGESASTNVKLAPLIIEKSPKDEILAQVIAETLITEEIVPPQHISNAPIEYARTVLAYADQATKDVLHWPWKGCEHKIVLDEMKNKILFYDEDGVEIYYCSHDYVLQFCMREIVVCESFPTEGDIAATIGVIASPPQHISFAPTEYTKKLRRVNALKFYLEDVIEDCKEQALKNDKNLKALGLYMAGKKIATEKFNKLPAKEKAKYEAKATKENAKNGVGAPPKSKTTMSNGTSKGGAKKKAKASIVQEESESDEEVSEESQGSGEEGSGEDESDLDGLLDESDEEEEPPKKKGGRKK